MALSSRTTSQINMPTSREAVERYQRLDVLGEGTYGVVYRATDRETGKTVALKKIRLDDSNEGIPQTALREVSILQEIHHQNIVNLLDVICGEGKLYLIFCLLYTSDAADEEDSVDLGGRRIIKKKKNQNTEVTQEYDKT
eukprot:TRINITY_DN51913_c0_g1_i1.p1 TRINITY_DN51913_c0_g1~~TRINITY_DN51913_c0_g1_i1.p1  ORF type:complete len:140 (-),score=53.25 TRINITY_DN51913_c0_g1_i1:69-488(-)